MKRNRGQVIAASIVLLALLAGMAGITHGFFRADYQRKLAEKAERAEAGERAKAVVERDKAIEAERKTVIERDKAEAVGTFLVRAFRKPDPSVDGKDVKIADILDQSLAELEKGFAGSEQTKGALLDTLGLSYVGLGLYPEAERALKKARSVREAALGPNHPETFQSMNNLGFMYSSAGKFDLALPLLEETLNRCRASLTPEHPGTLSCMNNLAAVYQKVGKLDLATPLLEETLKLTRATLGPDHPQTLTCMGNLAGAYRANKQLDRALPVLEETLKLTKAKLGPDHPDTFRSTNNLAVAYRESGKLALALPLFAETLEHLKVKLGPDHPDTLLSMNNLASEYWSLQQLDKSIPMFEDLLRRQESKLGRDHPSTLICAANLGVNYLEAHRPKEAIPLLEEALRSATKYPELRFVGRWLIDAYAQTGENTKLAKLLKEWLIELRKTLPNGSPQLAQELASLSLTLLHAKAFSEAEPLLRECLAIRQRTQPGVWSTSSTKSMLGGALLGQKKYAEAEPLLLAGYDGMKQREQTIPTGGWNRLAEALERLVQLFQATNKPDDAAKWHKELEDRKAQSQPK